MGHDIYARPTDQEDVTAQYFRMNMSGPSAPLYSALNAEPHYAGVSGDGGEENFTREEIITAIQELPNIFSDYIELKVDANQKKENYSWRFENIEPKKTAFDSTPWTKEETQTYYISMFTSEIEFLVRCLNLFDEFQTDSITIRFA